MLEFITADRLKSDYAVFGHFYSLGFVSGVSVDCRSVLEIVTKSQRIDITELSSNAPDAIVIMMNPGGSRPQTECLNETIPCSQISSLEIDLVPARPDVTQYQVMRVMKFLGWKHVRIVNLSDLRDPQNRSFIKRFNLLENAEGTDVHSLFSTARVNEFREKFNLAAGTTLIGAWGVSTQLDPLIEKCLARISKASPIAGLLKPNSKNKYYHPLPTPQNDKEAWVSEMVKLISKG